MDSVMSKTPPTAKKAVGSGALVVTIAIIPPSKATTPTTAMWIVSLSGSVRHAVIKLVLLFWWGPRLRFSAAIDWRADAAPICTTGVGA